MPSLKEAHLRHAIHYETVLRAADQLYEQGGDAAKQGLLSFELAWSNIQIGQSWAARVMLEMEHGASLCSSYPSVGAYLLDLRQSPRDRIRWRQEALVAARRLGDRRAEGWHLDNLGVAHMHLGQYESAMDFYKQHLDIAHNVSDERGKATALGNLGRTYAAMGMPESAIDSYNLALTLFRELLDRRGEAAALGNLGAVYANLGQTKRAIDVYEQALTILEEIGDRHREAAALGNLGKSYVELGKLNDSINFFQQALERFREVGDIRGEGEALWNLAQVAYRVGDPYLATIQGETALCLLQAIEDPNAENISDRLAQWREDLARQ